MKHPPHRSRPFTRERPVISDLGADCAAVWQPEQLLTDMRMEWKLVAFACQLLALRAGRQPWERAAHRLVKSTRNVRAPPWAGLAAHAPPVARGAPRAFHPTDLWPALQ